MQKSMPKKYRKLMPKGFQIDAKMDTKIIDFSICSKNTKNMKSSPAPTGAWFYRFWAPKIHEKSIQKAYKIDARKRYAKSMENYAKMEAKWMPRSLENLKICEKRHGQNQCWNLMLKNMQKTILGSLFGSIFGAVWGVWGVAEFKLRLQADFNSGFHTPCTPGGVRRMKKWCQKGPKIDSKIDILAIRGPTFEILGHVFWKTFFLNF